MLMWTMCMSGSYHLISQAGWNSVLYSTLLMMSEVVGKDVCHGVCIGTYMDICSTVHLL